MNILITVIPMFLLDQKLEGSGLKTWAQDFDRIFCTPIPRLHLLRVPEPRGAPIGFTPGAPGLP